MGNSLAVALPSQLAELADLEAGDVVVFDYLRKGSLNLQGGLAWAKRTSVGSES